MHPKPEAPENSIPSWKYKLIYFYFAPSCDLKQILGIKKK